MYGCGETSCTILYRFAGIQPEIDILCFVDAYTMDEQAAKQPQSPPLSALITSGEDLSLLDESDDLLSPSILGTAGACKVRVTHVRFHGIT